MFKTISKKGFSLVELLVVITIIAILSVVAYTAVGGQTAKARNSRRTQDLAAIQSALEIYAIQNTSTYPNVLDDGNPLTTADLVPKYMPKLPKDPASDALNYGYAKNGTLYKLAATIENEDGTKKAYVISNGADVTLAGVSCANVTDGGACLPYTLP